MLHSSETASAGTAQSFFAADTSEHLHRNLQHLLWVELAPVRGNP